MVLSSLLQSLKPQPTLDRQFDVGQLIVWERPQSMDQLHIWNSNQVLDVESARFEKPNMGCNFKSRAASGGRSNAHEITSPVFTNSFSSGAAQAARSVGVSPGGLRRTATK